MKYRWLIALLCVTLTACGKDGDSGGDAVCLGDQIQLASDDKKETANVESKPEAETPVLSAFETRSKNFDDATNKFMKAFRAAAPKDQQALMKDYPKAEDYAKDMLAIARVGEIMENEEETFNALLWAAQKSPSGDTYDTAVGKLTTDFIDREELKSLCMSLGYAQPSEKVESLINLLIEKSPHDSVKGLAIFAKANYLKRGQVTLKRIKDEDDQPEELIAYLESLDAEPKVLEALYQTLIDDYGDIQPSAQRKSTLKDMATNALFEMNNLAIGMKVPDIEAEDIEGVEFKLSDYRGKVVVIDFWGDW